MSDLEKYLELPYTIILRRDREGDFVAKIEELPGCSAHGKTREEALHNLEEAQVLWIEDCLEQGDPVPVPEEETLPSGKWLQRVPRTLHRRLQVLARREGVSFNHYVTAILAAASGLRPPVGEENTVSGGTKEVVGAAWAQYFEAGRREAASSKWSLVDVTPVRASCSYVVKGLSHLASQLPDKFEIRQKSRNDPKKNHAQFEVC